MSENTKTLLPVGTRIRFLKTLIGLSTEDSPEVIYARKGDFGHVIGHGCLEGHWVKWDNWPHEFGAEHGTEFVEAMTE